jgi:FlaA1/EpsC-like NDP-sugar epimerase
MLRYLSSLHKLAVKRILDCKQGDRRNEAFHGRDLRVKNEFVHLMQATMKLTNKVAFVTGGTSGIGLETAKLFHAEGAHVVLVGSNEERLAAAGKELNGKALLVRADIR